METVDQSNDDTAITSEIKRRYFSVIDSSLLELDARFGERCKPVYTALTTLSANGNDFFDVKKMKPLFELIPDPIIENDLCHEGEVVKPLILSKITKGHNIFQNIAAVKKVVIAPTTPKRPHPSSSETSHRTSPMMNLSNNSSSRADVLFSASCVRLIQTLCYFFCNS